MKLNFTDIFFFWLVGGYSQDCSFCTSQYTDPLLAFTGHINNSFPICPHCIYVCLYVVQWLEKFTGKIHEKDGFHIHLKEASAA